MKNFISEIKKINTDGLIYEFSKISIDMFRNLEWIKDIELPPVLRYGRMQRPIVSKCSITTRLAFDFVL